MSTSEDPKAEAWIVLKYGSRELFFLFRNRSYTLERVGILPRFWSLKPSRNHMKGIISASSLENDLWHELQDPNIKIIILDAKRVSTPRPEIDKEIWLTAHKYRTIYLHILEHPECGCSSKNIIEHEDIKRFQCFKCLEYLPSSDQLLPREGGNRLSTRDEPPQPIYNAKNYIKFLIKVLDSIIHNWLWSWILGEQRKEKVLEPFVDENPPNIITNTPYPKDPPRRYQKANRKNWRTIYIADSQEP